MASRGKDPIDKLLGGLSPARPRKSDDARRTNHIRVRLAPAPAPAVEVTLDDAEVAALDAAVTKAKIDGRSAMFREIGWAAASAQAKSLDAEEVFRAAAKSAHMGIGEWLRHITLSAIGESTLCEQIALAREAVQQGKIGA